MLKYEHPNLRLCGKDLKPRLHYIVKIKIKFSNFKVEFNLNLNVSFYLINNIQFSYLSRSDKWDFAEELLSELFPTKVFFIEFFQPLLFI